MSATPRIPVYVISLADCARRRQAVSDALLAIGLEFEFVDAVDGRTGLPDNPAFKVDPRTMMTKHGRDLSDGEIATALSHRLAYQRLLESGQDHALILEDDAIPSAALARFLDGGGHECAPLILCYHTNARVMPGSALRLSDGIDGRRLAVPCFGAVGYTLSRDAAAYLIEANTPIASPADWPGDITRIGAHVAIPQLVDHPPASIGQSIVAGTGRTRARAPLRRMINAAYMRRVWRKVQSERVS